MRLEKAIKKTIEYAGNFKSHINKKEINDRLISKKIFPINEVIEFIDKIGWKDKRNKWYRIKMEKAINLSKEISEKFKDIIFIGVSGSVASGHPKEKDDIDLFIITKTNKLWTSRFKMRWWIFRKQIPHRKRGWKEEKDQFCFNLWLDESELMIKKDKQNLKNGIDLILLKPILNRENIYEKFLLTNKWVKKWVATPYGNKTKDLRFMIQDSRIKQNFIDKLMNYLYFWPQYWYMRRKMRGERVGLHQAFFHRQMVK
jgi:hypothetical protein